MDIISLISHKAIVVEGYGELASLGVTDHIDALRLASWLGWYKKKIGRSKNSHSGWGLNTEDTDIQLHAGGGKKQFAQLCMRPIREAREYARSMFRAKRRFIRRMGAHDMGIRHEDRRFTPVRI